MRQYWITTTSFQLFLREHTVVHGCLYLVADKRHPWVVLAWKVAFRVAFGGFILVQFVVFVLLLWAGSRVLPEDNDFVTGTVLVLVLISPFAIGASSHFAFQRFTRVEYVLSESERWLAERRKRDAQQIRRRNRLRRWTMWIPVTAVVLFCLFLDQSWPVLTHIVHPNYGRLGAYRVSMPLDWSIIFSQPDPGKSQGRSYVRAEHWRGMLRSAMDEFSGRMPSLTNSSLGCDSSRSYEDHAFSSLPDRDRLVDTRRFSKEKVTLTCEEFVSRDPWTARESRTVWCVSAEGDFDCGLYGGDDRDASAFYDIVQHIRKVK